MSRIDNPDSPNIILISFFENIWKNRNINVHLNFNGFVRSIFGTSEREMRTQIWTIVLLFLTRDGVTQPRETCWSIPRNQITQINKDLIFSNLQSSTQTTKILISFFFFFFSPILWFLSFVQIWRSEHCTTTIRSKPTSSVIAWRPDLGCDCTRFAIWVIGLVLVVTDLICMKKFQVCWWEFIEPRRYEFWFWCIWNNLFLMLIQILKNYFIGQVRFKCSNCALHLPHRHFLFVS